MNAAVSAEVLLKRADDSQAALPLAAPGVQRWVWESRYGAMLIEVIQGQVFVNGQRVQPHEGQGAAAGPSPLQGPVTGRP